jgi:hypothetical protein
MHTQHLPQVSTGLYVQVEPCTDFRLMELGHDRPSGSCREGEFAYMLYATANCLQSDYRLFEVSVLNTSVWSRPLTTIEASFVNPPRPRPNLVPIISLLHVLGLHGKGARSQVAGTMRRKSCECGEYDYHFDDSACEMLENVIDWYRSQEDGPDRRQGATMSRCPFFDHRSLLLSSTPPKTRTARSQHRRLEGGTASIG